MVFLPVVGRGREGWDCFMAVRKLRRGLLEVGFGVVGSKTVMLMDENVNGNGRAFAMPVQEAGMGWDGRSFVVRDRSMVRSQGIEMGREERKRGGGGKGEREIDSERWIGRSLFSYI